MSKIGYTIDIYRLEVIRMNRIDQRRDRHNYIDFKFAKHISRFPVVQSLAVRCFVQAATTEFQACPKQGPISEISSDTMDVFKQLASKKG